MLKLITHTHNIIKDHQKVIALGQKQKYHCAQVSGLWMVRLPV